MPKHMFSLHEIIDFGIRIEENGEAFYREAQKKESSPELRALFQTLADDEAKHREWFFARKEAMGREVRDPMTSEIERGILQDIIGNQTFSLKDADLSIMKETGDVIELAMEFERDTIVFYEMILEFIDSEDDKEKLRELIREENLHISLLEEYK